MKTAQTIAAQQASTDPESAATPKSRRAMHPKSLANLVAPWKPGQSGNPEGAKRHDVAAAISRAALENNQAEIYKAVTKKLLAGDAYAFVVHAERGYGKLKEVHQHTFDEDVLKALESGRKRAARNQIVNSGDRQKA